MDDVCIGLRVGCGDRRFLTIFGNKTRGSPEIGAAIASGSESGAQQRVLVSSVDREPHGEDPLCSRTDFIPIIPIIPAGVFPIHTDPRASNSPRGSFALVIQLVSQKSHLLLGRIARAIFL